MLLTNWIHLQTLGVEVGVGEGVVVGVGVGVKQENSWKSKQPVEVSSNLTATCTFPEKSGGKTILIVGGINVAPDIKIQVVNVTSHK